MGGQAQAAATRQLHRMQRDLLRIARMLGPLQAVVASLVSRAEGLQHAAAATALSQAPSTALLSAAQSGLASPVHASTSTYGEASLVAGGAGLISTLTRTYLSDVRDHIFTLSETMSSTASECKDLVRLSWFVHITYTITCTTSS